MRDDIVRFISKRSFLAVLCLSVIVLILSGCQSSESKSEVCRREERCD